MGKIMNALIFLFILSHVPGYGQDDYIISPDPIVSSRVIFPVKELAKQNSYKILIEINIQDGWHINSDKPLDEFLIASEIRFSESEEISFGKIQYPEAELVKFSFSDSKLLVYDGRVYALTTVTISPDFQKDSLTITGDVYYQACNDQLCLAPQIATFQKKIPVVASGMVVQEDNQNLFASVAAKFQETAEPSAESSFSQVIKESGLVYAFLFIFLGGLALNLTPCVYPLIPITISYFGGQSQGKKGGLIIRAIVYVLGMAITYSLLGVVASLTGGLLGSALQNPLVLLFVAAVLLALALSMFGLYEIRVPQSLALIGSKNRSGYFGTLFMGLTVGVIAAPCIGPFVLGLLTYVGEIGDPFLGFWMFFVLALGLGFPFLLLGIFSGAITNLPRSGAWMVWVRNIFGFILIGMAIYFLEPLFSAENYYYYTLALLASIAGVYLGWLDKNKGTKIFNVSRYAVGVMFIAFGIYLALPGSGHAGEELNWQPYSETAIQSARENDKAVIIDFYADWCIPCKELDKFTFNDSKVVEKGESFVLLKADLTQFDSEITENLRKQYSIKGVPTIVFLGKDGNEKTGLRLVGFEEADKFVERMETTIR